METAKQAGRTNFGAMINHMKAIPSIRVLLVEKTDRLSRYLKDWVTLDELDVEIHFVKEGVVLSRDSRSSEKFMHGIKVLMAKNYIDNLSEEARRGMQEKTEQEAWPTVAPLGYLNVTDLDGRIDAAFFDRLSADWHRDQEQCLRDIEQHQVADQSYLDEGVQLLELARSAQRLFANQASKEMRRLLGFLVSNRP